jgi:hypothetical protein
MLNTTNIRLKPTSILTVLFLSLLAITPAVDGVAREPVVQAPSGLGWREPFDVAKEEAGRTGKPMLVFIGNTEACPDCKEFAKKVCEAPEFISFAQENLVCTRLLYSALASKEEQWKMTRNADKYNMTPRGHAVIIANSKGVRIGELSTSVTSMGSFISEIKEIIAKAPPEGRLKYSEVAMLDKTFVPAKTYTTPPPEFSKKPLQGRYINFMSAIRLHTFETTRARLHGETKEKNRFTCANAIKLRNAMEAGFPGARMTWAWSWGALNCMDSNFVELRKLMVDFHKQYGDEITFFPGVYFANKFNTEEQVKKDLHDGLELVSKMMGDGYRPKSIVAGHMSAQSMKYIADNEGIHTIQGQIWSQYDIDGQDGDGGILYPYYPSKQHFLKPAQGPRGSEDFLDMVNIDGWSMDFFAARKRGLGKDYNSRVGIGPIETYINYGPTLGLTEMLHTSEIYFNNKAVAENGYGFLTVNWELGLLEWINPQYLIDWLTALRTKYPDTQMLALGEFGDLWRKHNPDNRRINLKFVERGNDKMPTAEDWPKFAPDKGTRPFHGAIFRPEMEIRWYFNKDFRFATIQNWKENGPKLVMDYTRYNQPYKEPSGNVIERHWDILDMINQKESRPQDKPKPFAELPQAEQQKILKWYPELKELTQ